eukprot:scaffold149_cov315-Pinguiococcus_pyrenoidosus.AAC.75
MTEFEASDVRLTAVQARSSTSYLWSEVGEVGDAERKSLSAAESSSRHALHFPDERVIMRPVRHPALRLVDLMRPAHQQERVAHILFSSDCDELRRSALTPASCCTVWQRRTLSRPWRPAFDLRHACGAAKTRVSDLNIFTCRDATSTSPRLHHVLLRVGLSLRALKNAASAPAKSRIPYRANPGATSVAF